MKSPLGYPEMPMKTTVDVDRELADEAAEILGTKTLKDTVNAALREVVRKEHLKQLADSVREGTLPVPTLEELARLRGRVA
jgi:Arc/MetJ family transcription regulator